MTHLTLSIVLSLSGVVSAMIWPISWPFSLFIVLLGVFGLIPELIR